VSRFIVSALLEPVRTPIARGRQCNTHSKERALAFGQLLAARCPARSRNF